MRYVLRNLRYISSGGKLHGVQLFECGVRCTVIGTLMVRSSLLLQMTVVMGGSSTFSPCSSTTARIAFYTNRNSTYISTTALRIKPFSHVYMYFECQANMLSEQFKRKGKMANKSAVTEKKSITIQHERALGFQALDHLSLKQVSRLLIVKQLTDKQKLEHTRLVTGR